MVGLKQCYKIKHFSSGNQHLSNHMRHEYLAEESALACVQKRYRLAASVCTSVAAILVEVPASEFGQALAWLNRIENDARQGTWRPDSPAKPVTSVDLDQQDLATVVCYCCGH